MPVRNAAQWLHETFESVWQQNIDNMNIELSIYNDGSSASYIYVERHSVFCFLLGRNFRNN